MGNGSKIFVASAALVACCAFGVSPASGQVQIRREIRQTPDGVVLDFRQDGVWRRRVREIAAQRAQQRGGLPPGAGVAQGIFVPAVTGVLRVPAIFFRYQDQGTGTVHTINDLQDRLFGQTPPAGLPYTIRTFYDEMSGGVFRIEGQAVGWLTLNNNEETYTGTPPCVGNPTGTSNCNGIFGNSIAGLHVGLAEAINKADPSIDFGNFDNDGPDGVPNSGDDDGVVDLAAFYHSELDGSCGGATNNHIWAHRFSLTPVATTDARFGGGVITVRDYVVQGGVGGPGGCTATLPVAIGTSTHEFGHGLGLPDFYDTGGPTEGVGQWDLMGSGNWTTQPSPSRMSAFSLNEMGWINIVDVTATTSLVLPPITSSRTAYAIRVQGSNPRGEYFLLENRQGTLSDSAMIRSHCGTSGLVFPVNCAGGLAVWHIDSLKMAQSLSSNSVNSGTIHGLALVQADGLSDLDTPNNRGDAGDVWPGTSGAATFDTNSNPAAVKNDDGSWVGFDLNSITQVTPNGNVSFDVVFAVPVNLSVAPTNFAVSVTEGATTPVAGSASVTLTGTGAGSTSWTASAGGASWVTPIAFAGTGSGTIQWDRNPTGLTAGTYIATITVTAAGAVGSPTDIIDTLIIQPPLVMSLTPNSRSDTTAAGATTTIPDSATVSFSGTGAGTAAWTAVHGAGAWLTVTTPNGVGPGLVRWSRDPTGLAAGTYVDTITVTSAATQGSPDTVIDTLVVTPPLTMAVTPSSRSDTIAVGATALIADSANVSFAGTGSATAGWTATHGAASWLSISTPNGVGNAVVGWNRDPTGLAAGTYVDTVTIVSTGAIGSPATVIDSLVVIPALVMNLDPASRADTVVEGAVTSIPDSVNLTFTGTGAATAPWTAVNGGGSWLTISTPSGTGDAIVRWTRNPTGLVAGTYVDTVTVTAAGAVGSPDTVVDTLVVLPPLTMSVAPTSRHDSVIAGSPTIVPDTASVSFAGAGAGSAAWSAASTGAAWVSISQGTGVGNGIVIWNRDPSGLAPGVYVDTIIVTAAALGSPASVIDSLTVLPALSMTLTPANAFATVVQGGAVVIDTAAVAFSGTGAASASWTAAQSSGSWLTLTNSAGTGNGSVIWSRDPSGLVPGIYVDTITVTSVGATGSPAMLIDTLQVTDALALSVSPQSLIDSVTEGATSAPGGVVTISFTGTGAAQAQWNASHGGAGWLVLGQTSGVGPGTLSWVRNPAGLAAGVYVDTVTVSAAGALGSPATVVDTLKVLVLPDPLTLAVLPTSRSVQVNTGAGPVADTANVNLSGTGAGSAVWTAVHGSASWLTLTTAGGTGGGQVTWLRNPSGLAPGTYVDTISVSSTGAIGSPARVIDTLIVTEPTIPLTLRVEPTGRRSSAVSGQNVSQLDSARVVVEGTGSAGAIWVASSSAAWSTFSKLSGSGTSYMRWTRNAISIAPGVYVDTVTIATDGAVAQFVDTLDVAAPAISADDVVRELLEGGVLSEIHRQYLDSIGNNDGVFNLGDVLAHLDRLGAAVPPVLRERVIGRSPGDDS